MVSPVVRDRLANQVAKATKSLILSGELKGGDRLPSEAEIARIFGVGRGTVRAAKQELEMLGIIEVRSGRPTRVAPNAYHLLASGSPFTLTTAGLGWMEILEGRRHFEGMLADLAAQWATEEDVTRLKWALDEMHRHADGDLTAHVEADKKFHLAVAKAAGNKLLYELYKECLQLAEQMLNRALFIPENRAQTNSRHVPVYEAIRDRDPRRARRSIEAALRATETAMQTYFLQSAGSDEAGTRRKGIAP